MNTREYNKVVNELGDSLYAFALQFTGYRHLALDAVQDSFVVLWNHVEQIPYDNARKYLFRVLRNKLIDLYRHQKHGKAFSNSPPQELSLPTEQYDMHDSLHIALLQLPDLQRSLVILKEVEGFSCKEIAEMMDLSDQQVMTYLYRAKVKLRKQLEYIIK